MATETFIDPRGDVPTADLIRIRTVATDEVVIIELEFASAEDRAQSLPSVVIAEPRAQGTPICAGFFSQYTVKFWPEPDVVRSSAILLDANAEHVADLEAAANGPWMSVAVPLSLIGDPPALYFSVVAITSEGLAEGALGEYSPDATGACHTASLGP